MFHACAARFDAAGNLENFLDFGHHPRTQQGFFTGKRYDEELSMCRVHEPNGRPIRKPLSFFRWCSTYVSTCVRPGLVRPFIFPFHFIHACVNCSLSSAHPRAPMCIMHAWFGRTFHTHFGSAKRYAFFSAKVTRVCDDRFSFMSASRIIPRPASGPLQLHRIFPSLAERGDQRRRGQLHRAQLARQRKRRRMLFLRRDREVTKTEM